MHTVIYKAEIIYSEFYKFYNIFQSEMTLIGFLIKIHKFLTFTAKMDWNRWICASPCMRITLQ